MSPTNHHGIIRQAEALEVDLARQLAGSDSSEQFWTVLDALAGGHYAESCFDLLELAECSTVDDVEAGCTEATEEVVSDFLDGLEASLAEILGTDQS